MSNQTFIKNNFNIQNNLNSKKTALNNNLSGNNTNRHLSATHINNLTKEQVKKNSNLKKLNQHSHSDSSNSFIRQEIMVK